jgi:hypothetical protein
MKESVEYSNSVVSERGYDKGPIGIEGGISLYEQ